MYTQLTLVKNYHNYHSSKIMRKINTHTGCEGLTSRLFFVHEPQNWNTVHSNKKLMTFVLRIMCSSIGISVRLNLSINNICALPLVNRLDWKGRVDWLKVVNIVEKTLSQDHQKYFDFHELFMYVNQDYVKHYTQLDCSLKDSACWPPK